MEKSKIDLTMAPSTRFEEYAKQAQEGSAIEILGGPVDSAAAFQDLANMQKEAFAVMNDHFREVLTHFERDMVQYTNTINAVVKEQKKVINAQAEKIDELEIVLDAVIKMTMFDQSQIPDANAEEYKAAIAKFVLRNRLMTVADTEAVEKNKGTDKALGGIGG